MDNKPIKVLLIEDNPADAFRLRRTLTKATSAQFELAHAKRLGQALQRLGEESFDLVLLDLTLPDSQGLEAFAKIQAQVPEAPIVVLTGLDDEALAIKVVQEGAQDYWVKGSLDNNLLVRSCRYAIERQRRLRQRADFLAMFAHDIKNPLGVILGYAGMLRKMGGPSLEQEDMVRRLEVNARAALSLVANYLDLSKIEAGRLILVKKPLGLNELLSRVGQQYEAEAQRQHITLEFHLQQELPAVEGDALALERVFANLVHNALKFTPKLGRVTIRSGQQNSEVVVAVADTGPGIASEEVPFVFEKYRRAAVGQSREGVGLGLFIVKALVEAHAGRVEVESTPGQGSCFSVYLPVASAAQAQA